MSAKFQKQNLEAEAFLLALICQDPDVVDEIPKLTPLDFTSNKNRFIYQAVQRLIRSGEPIDEPHVIGIVSDNDPPVEEDYVRSTFRREAPTGGHIRYFKLVRDRRVLTNIFRFGGKASEQVVGFGVDDDIETLIDKVEKGAMKIRNDIEFGDAFSDASDVMKRIAQEALHPETLSTKLVHTGFPEIDTYITAMRGGDIVFIAGRPSDGKTALMIQIAINIHLQKKVGIVSLEMTEDQLMGRVGTNLSGVSSNAVAAGQVTAEQLNMFVGVCNSFPTERIYIDDTGGQTIEHIRGKMRRMVKTHGCDLLMLDYIQQVKLPQGGTESTADKIQIVSNELKSVFKELDVPGVVAVQLNRDSAKEERPPRVFDLRGSGALEQDADHIFAIFRPDGHKNPGFDLHHLKGRNTGEMEHPVSLYYRTECQRIMPIMGGNEIEPKLYAEYRKMGGQLL